MFDATVTGFRFGVGLAVAVLVVGGAIVIGRSSRRTSPGAPVARALLRRVRVPAGAVSSASEPSGDDGELSTVSDNDMRASAARAHAWWIVPGRPSAVLAAVVTRAKRAFHATFKASSTDSFGQVPRRSEVLQLPRNPGSPARELIFATVGLPHGSTALRVDANVGAMASSSAEYTPGATTPVLTVSGDP